MAHDCDYDLQGHEESKLVLQAQVAAEQSKRQHAEAAVMQLHQRYSQAAQVMLITMIITIHTHFSTCAMCVWLTPYFARQAIFNV